MEDAYKLYSSIEELDKALFDNPTKEIKDIPETTEEPKEEEAKPEDETEETEESEEEATEEEDEEEEEEEPQPKETPKPKKPSPDEKRNYAFGKIRKELTEKEKALADREETLNLLLKESGFNNYDEFRDALKAKVAQDEKAKMGYTDEQFAEVQRLRERNKQLEEFEKQVSKTETANRAKQFDGEVRSFAEKYHLGDKGVAQIYDELQKSGYTVQTLLSLPNPQVLIKGIMADQIENLAVATHITKKATRKAVDGERLIATPNADDNLKAQQDKMLKDDLADYRKRFGR